MLIDDSHLIEPDLESPGDEYDFDLAEMAWDDQHAERDSFVIATDLF